MNRRASDGFTVLEILLVVAIIGVVIAALSPLFLVVRTTVAVNNDSTETLQNARVAMDYLVRTVRQSKEIVAYSAATDTNGYLELLDNSDSTVRFSRSFDTGAGWYGLAVNDQPLAGALDAFTVTGYRADSVANPTPTLIVDELYSLKLTATFSLPGGVSPPVTLSATIYPPRTRFSIVINEIMYNPNLTFAERTTWGEQQYEWIELYNSSARSIDMNGWIFRDNGKGDAIRGYLGGPTVIPPGGYALLTANPTRVYGDVPVDSAAVRLIVDDARIGNGLDNKGESSKILTPNNVLIDLLDYDQSWGGDNNDRTLERVNVHNRTNIAANWLEGPLFGTAGRKNSVSP